MYNSIAFFFSQVESGFFFFKKTALWKVLPFIIRIIHFLNNTLPFYRQTKFDNPVGIWYSFRWNRITIALKGAFSKWKRRLYSAKAAAEAQN